MGKFKAQVSCVFDIEVDDTDIKTTIENIMLSNTEEVLNMKTESSIESIRVIKIREMQSSI